MARRSFVSRLCTPTLPTALVSALLGSTVGCGDDKPTPAQTNVPDAKVDSTSDASARPTPSSDGGVITSADGGGSVKSLPPDDERADAQAPPSGSTDVDPCVSCDASTGSTETHPVTEPDAGMSTETLPSDFSSEPNVPTDPSAKWLAGEPLFAPSAIATVRLQISAEGLDSLNTDSRTYVPGSLEVVLADGTSYQLDEVGMRLKGQWGSGRTLDEKAAFLLKMNEFVPDQKLLSLNKLALNNLVQDPTMIREQLSYKLFREMGVPAPRTSYAVVTLNDELMGLYATVEVVDNASFLDHWFGNDDGNLYEGSYGSDLEDDLIATFDQDRGPENEFADLYELSAALDEMSDPSTFVTQVQPWVDLDAYARFAATELFLGHWDGYAATRNNYFLYRAPGAKWSFIPWGTDQTFGNFGLPIFEGTGRLQTLCAASLECREKLAAAYERLVELTEELDLLARVDELEALITPAVEQDPRKENDTATFHTEVEALREFLRVRPLAARDGLKCTDPSTVDEDEDGASGCGEDCNDGDPARYPGATEVCNFVDDDCNGQIDELNECERCREHERDGGGLYALCVGPSSYLDAQADCQERGGDLVSIHSAEEQEQIDALVEGIALNEWWIGFSDREDEGEFLWEDGSSVEFENWNQGEPNNTGGGEHCALLTGWGGWNDRDCAAGLAYICTLP